MHQLELTTIKRQWIDDAASQFALIKSRLGQFDFDEMHKLLPEPEQPCWWGIFSAQLAKAGIIRRVGARASKRPEANGRLISVWEVVADK